MCDTEETKKKRYLLATEQKQAKDRLALRKRASVTSGGEQWYTSTVRHERHVAKYCTV